MSLWRSYVSVVSTDDEVHEPPDELLGIVVVSGVAYLSRHQLDDVGNPEPEAAGRSLATPARSLLHALEAAIAADEDEVLMLTMHRLREDRRQRSP